MGKICSLEGCGRPHAAKGYCRMHYKRWGTQDATTGNTIGSINGYPTIRGLNIHGEIAKKVLGKPLPLGAEVHHVDGNESNFDNTNLVICPNRAYHMLLHVRTNALDACGNANYRKCPYCKKWDDPKNMVQHGSNNTYEHRKCLSDYMKQRYHNANTALRVN